MVRNKILRSVFYNLLLIGSDIWFPFGWHLLASFIEWLFPIVPWGGGYAGVLFMMVYLLSHVILCGAGSRLLFRKTWIPNMIHTLTVFFVVYVWAWRSLPIAIIAALLCGVISSGASLITWAIQCKVQKRRAAKQAVLLEE